MEQFEEHLFSLEELQILCSYWQKKLRIYDWTIGLRICRVNDIGECRQGEIVVSEVNGSAQISILDSIDYPKDHYLKQDMEVILVHELVHLRFFPDVRNKQKEILARNLMEQAVDRTAQALVELRRSGKDKNIHKVIVEKPKAKEEEITVAEPKRLAVKRVKK